MKLLQHEYLDDPWKMMVVCSLLGKSHESSVKRLLPDLFEWYPTPNMLNENENGVLTELFKPLGYSDHRASRLIRMSQDACDGKVIGLWHGAGSRAVDSWMIFVCGAVIWPDDKYLRLYMEWCADRGVMPPSYTNEDGRLIHPEPLKVMRLS